MPWRRERLPTPVFWPGEFHGLYSLWGHKESDTTEWLSLSLSAPDLQTGDKQSYYFLNKKLYKERTLSFHTSLRGSIPLQNQEKRDNEDRDYWGETKPRFLQEQQAWRESHLAWAKPSLLQTGFCASFCACLLAPLNSSPNLRHLHFPFAAY